MLFIGPKSRVNLASVPPQISNCSSILIGLFKVGEERPHGAFLLTKLIKTVLIQEEVLPKLVHSLLKIGNCVETVIIKMEKLTSKYHSFIFGGNLTNGLWQAVILLGWTSCMSC